MLRSWLSYLLIGAVVTVLLACASVSLIADMRAQARPPTWMTVEEIGAHFKAGGGTLPHVRLTDLVVDCRATLLANRRPYVLAHAAHPRNAQVLIELDGDVDCHALAQTPVGEVSRGDENLWWGADVPHGTPLLRPLAPLGWVLAMCMAFTGAGIFLMVTGLRNRRHNIALMADMTRAPVAVDPVTSSTHPGGAYRSVDPERFLLPRPMQLNARWRRHGLWHTAAVITAGAGIVVGLGYWLAGLVHARWVWRHGERATHAEIRITGKRVVLFDSHDLAFNYTDRQGQPRFGTYWRFALLSRITDSPIEVRYDPADPDDAAPSLAIDNIAGEWYAFGLLALLGAGLVHGMHTGLRRKFADSVRLRELIHAGPEEVVLAVRSSESCGPENSQVRYVFATPEGFTFDETFDASHPPFHLEPFGPEVLAIRHPRDHEFIVVLRHDLWPLAADNEEVGRVRGRYHPPTVTTGVRRSAVKPPRIPRKRRR